ncbi:hypothetical protein D5086_017398 [Populus alba]|uniref:Uncharacterized protein n=1 Tax=Populus alba TaxID=43335 RepID=A0ACC4BXW3_POPAL
MGFLRKQTRDLHNRDSPSNWKKSKPSWMDWKVWEEMCDRWFGHDYEKIREKNWQNRHYNDSSDAGAPTTYAREVEGRSETKLHSGLQPTLVGKGALYSRQSILLLLHMCNEPAPTEIMTLQKELRDHAQFMDSRFNSFEDHLEDILRRKGFSLPNSQPPQDSDEDRQDKGL